MDPNRDRPDWLALARSRPCDVCGALPGEGCTFLGEPIPKPHIRRVEPLIHAAAS